MSGSLVWCSPSKNPYCPTAVHAVAEMHDTAVRSRKFEPGGAGTGWSVHVVPSQNSAPASPTATHAVADGHDTPDNERVLAVCWSVHVLPSQRSATAPPTAVHAVADVHDTAAIGPPAAGVARTFHRLPFQAFATPPATEDPTAMHALAAEHDIPVSTECGALAFGLRTCDHPDAETAADADAGAAKNTPDIIRPAATTDAAPRACHQVIDGHPAKPTPFSHPI